MALLEVKNICKSKSSGFFLNDISFEQQSLQKVAIAGESGAGKTTLLKIISGHVQADSGSVLFEGKKILGPDEQLLPGHKEIGYLSQHYELRTNYYVEELMRFQFRLSPEESEDLFKICRINKLLKRRTDEISGGEKQRIALCLLLMKLPRLLVLDEPFSNLDPIHTGILKEVLEDITDRLKLSVLLTSHDPHDTLSWADKIIVIKEGNIIQKGTPHGIYHQPVNEYVAGMFGRYNLLNPDQAAIFGINANGKNVMLRPEEFQISSTATEGVKGLIQKISFWGSYFDAEVVINEFLVVVRMMKSECHVGEEVFVKTGLN